MTNLFLFIICCGFFFQESEIIALTRYASGKKLIQTTADTVYVKLDSSLLEHKNENDGFTYNIGSSNYRIITNEKIAGNSSVFSIAEVTYLGAGNYRVSCSFKEAGTTSNGICFFKFHDNANGDHYKDSMILYKYDKGVTSHSDVWDVGGIDSSGRRRAKTKR